MPYIPSVARETTCCGGSLLGLSEEEEAEAEKSLSSYCKPVELYNILHHRAVEKPLFLQRCLRYKREAKHKRRIQLTISLYVPVDHVLQIQSLFPLYIMLAKPDSKFSIAEQSARYRFKRCFALSTCDGDEGTRFVLPESNKLLAEIKSGSLAVLFISYVGGGLMDFASFQTQGGQCMIGNIPMELLDLSCGTSSNLREGSETILTVDLHACVIKTSCVDGDKCISFQAAPTPAILASKQRLEVIFTAEELGAKDLPPHGSNSYNDIPRLRNGEVVFNYMYYNNKLQRNEVTEDFSCPFCWVKCASFKGLKSHLFSCHDLFKFDFPDTERYLAVNVYVKPDTWRSEIVADGVNIKKHTFSFWSKLQRRRKPKNIFPVGNHHVHSLDLESDQPMEADELHDAPADTLTLPESSITAVSTLRFGKTRKRSLKNDPNIGSLLQRRQFFHSRHAQPMAMEQVLSELDSEDKIDYDIADLEDQRMLDDFVDVTNDEKQMMHMWNSFVRRKRVLVDAHIPWACEAFSRLHVAYLVQTPTLLWCWRLLMMKLWKHGLLDARSMNNCNNYFWPTR